MVNITNKQGCCGCAACEQKCPRQCISLYVDFEGFCYPQVNTALCINCGLCEKVCPVLHPFETRQPLQILAANNKNEIIRRESSSGGIFTLLAEKIIKEGGVVFGARFDRKWQVVLDYTETIEGLAAFRGSKYVQASIGKTFKRCEQFLKEGRKVLFTGTQCQIAGLHKYLNKNYDNLTTCDFVCHGVPSPKVWSMYLDEIMATALQTIAKRGFALSETNAMTSIQNIKFRDKSNGWKKFCFVICCSDGDDKIEGSSPMYSSNIVSESVDDNIYMKAFISNLILRPSCYKCPARKGKSKSDITIADYWGIQTRHPELDDNIGTSLVLIYSQKGKRLFSFTQTLWVESSLDGLSKFNGGLKEETTMHPRRDIFFASLTTADNISQLIKKNILPSKVNRIKNKFRSLFGRMGQEIVNDK